MLTEFFTGLGHMALATLEGQVVGLTFGHGNRELALGSLQRFHASGNKAVLNEVLRDNSSESTFLSKRVAELLEKFAEGEPVNFDDIPIALTDMTLFQKQVVAACRAIPWGQTVSYGELATIVGRPGAARAVGTVMRKNRVPLIVPCHRVLASGGLLGGYSAPSGLEMKKRLLALERREQSAGLF
jgi:methylated-DNA-[protein]-cysteine S-methyltransferase